MIRQVKVKQKIEIDYADGESDIDFEVDAALVQDGEMATLRKTETN